LFIIKEWNELFHTCSSPSSSDATVTAACYQENSDYYESLYYYQQLEKKQLKQKNKRLFSSSLTTTTTTNSNNSDGKDERDKKKNKTEKENEVENIAVAVSSVVSPSLTTSVLFSIPIPIASHHPAAWNLNFSKGRPTLEEAMEEMKMKNEEITMTSTSVACSTSAGVSLGSTHSPLSSSLPSTPATVGRGRPPGSGRKAKSPKVTKKGEKESKSAAAVSPSKESESADPQPQQHHHHQHHHQHQHHQHQHQHHQLLVKKQQHTCLWETIHPAFIRSASTASSSPTPAIASSSSDSASINTTEAKELIPSISSSSNPASSLVIVSPSPANLPLNLVQFSISILEQQIHELESCNLSYLCSVVKKVEREQKLHEVLRKKRKNLDDLYYKLFRYNESKICSRSVYPKQFPKSNNNISMNTKRTVKQSSSVMNNNDNRMR
jgi:hypothetical protein